ncbi:plasmid maintenance system antidote protein [Thiovulum sp. ES]|nr:plasmid maintenance system antidote protein [Thiovulum sp. ES]
MEHKEAKNEENIVKKTCRELGITQKELAEKIGITEKTVNNWANNRVKIPNNFNRLIELLKIENNCKKIVSAVKNIETSKISLN